MIFQILDDPVEQRRLEDIEVDERTQEFPLPFPPDITLDDGFD
jgi:hypothetical protein